MRASTPESSILPRESISGPPPPVPRKDTRPNTQIYELPAEQAGDAMQKKLEELDAQELQQSQKLRFVLSNMLESQNSATGEMKIYLEPSTSKPRSPEKKTPPPTTMSTMHPLAMSPPMPILSMPKVPQRPARPSSLRLSSFTRKRDLTTNRVVVLNTDKPETGSLYQTQPHTGYHGSSRTKYGRGKHATTELIPQPSDDPQDPLVRARL